jgi:hypothetical protein
MPQGCPVLVTAMMVAVAVAARWQQCFLRMDPVTAM